VSIKAAYRLMRFDKPIGIALLWWPTAWALWLANQGMPAYSLLFWFLLGTLLMRAAGCVANDIADRRIDLHVSRTRHRPLTSGAIGLIEAMAWLAGLLIAALMVLLQLPTACFSYALLAVMLALTYPFFKRFFPTPQAVLSLAFSMGIPMAYVASGTPFDGYLWTLLFLNIIWVLAYDTIYACVDQTDDEKLGVHSTARFWGRYTKPIVIALLCVVQLGWLLLLLTLNARWFAYGIWGIAGFNLVKQMRAFMTPNPVLWFEAFKSNGFYGFWLWLSLLH
jgi:4-hydroxybenzoate polyprenyltransferase